MIAMNSKTGESMSTNLIDTMTEREAKHILNDVCSLLSIPGRVRSEPHIIYAVKELIIKSQHGK
jgi:hypothetical protein